MPRYKSNPEAPRPSGLQATIHLPRYGSPMQQLSARHAASFLWLPQGKPDDGHQSVGDRPHKLGCAFVTSGLGSPTQTVIAASAQLLFTASASLSAFSDPHGPGQ